MAAAADDDDEDEEEGEEEEMVWEPMSARPAQGEGTRVSGSGGKQPLVLLPRVIG
jgi:hypothetical protein